MHTHTHTHFGTGPEVQNIPMSSIRCGKRKKKKEQDPIIQRRLICQPANLFQISHPRKGPEGRSQKKNKKEAKGNNSKDQSSSLVSFSIYNNKNVYLCSRRNELKRRRMTSPNNACVIRSDPIPPRNKRSLPWRVLDPSIPILSCINNI